MHRREVLRLLAIGAGAQCLEGLAPEQVLAFGRAVHARRRHRGTAAALRALDAHANATVTAAAERIIPSSETPGATDAGVTTFIDHVLAAWYTPAERDRVLDGLRKLDARARTRHGADFVDCVEADQVALLSAIDDEVTALRRAPRNGANPNDHWFAMLKYLTVWGYCTSEVGMRDTLGAYPLPLRYDPCAPYAPPNGATPS